MHNRYHRLHYIILINHHSMTPQSMGTKGFLLRYRACLRSVFDVLPMLAMVVLLNAVHSSSLIADNENKRV
ncbi:hypothetical protein BP00DRAFT_68085 [Aspergillus indologenus CBS 114.80]|uniref:Uncharacterized protein n=1 Tax=Aspergillus indologenus CBS 114.80 TaxID=1450541 RepID=A0A2V5HP69_9EURO|nr:hypothetical protein BP00DRAFT_68085 [Aspergillus indologenus CBS 114.80]